jgi:glycerol-3-phosphate dehydrogenase
VGPLRPGPDPRASEEEIAFILERASRYLRRPATRADVRSVFAGIRPLVSLGDAHATAALSRDHVIHINPDSGLVTIAGGKWTTYRRMAQDLVVQAITPGGLPERPCVTTSLNLHGWRQPTEHGDAPCIPAAALRDASGTDSDGIAGLDRSDPRLAEPVQPRLPVTWSEIVWGIREEMAVSVDDLLARRTRSLLFDAQAAIEAAPAASGRIAETGGNHPATEELLRIARRSLV